jgi:hypothetical protein
MAQRPPRGCPTGLGAQTHARTTFAREGSADGAVEPKSTIAASSGTISGVNLQHEQNMILNSKVGERLYSGVGARGRVEARRIARAWRGGERSVSEGHREVGGGGPEHGAIPQLFPPSAA